MFLGVDFYKDKKKTILDLQNRQYSIKIDERSMKIDDKSMNIDKFDENR